MAKSELNHELFDVMIKHAVKDYLEEEYLSDMQNCEKEPEPPFDSNFLAGIHKIRVKAKWDHRLRSVRKTLPKAAVIILVSLAVLSGLVMSVEAWRVEIFNFLFHAKNDHMEITLVGDDGQAAEIPSKQYYYPSYLPEGFIPSHAEKAGGYLVIEFTGQDNERLIFQQYSETGSTFLINTEGKYTEKIELNSGIGYCAQDEDSLTMIWNQNEYSFLMLTTLDKKEAVKIANSIEWVTQ